MCDQVKPKLLVRPRSDHGECLRITPQSAGWEHLGFAVQQLGEGESWTAETEGFEYGLVILGGTCRIESNRGTWERLGGRTDVFSGMPHALYLPPGSRFRVMATSSRLHLAAGWCAAEGRYPARVVRPADCAIEIRGGGNATRQINSIFPPGFPCERLVAVEVYTPAGNWSSYPPHKHDVHREDAGGRILEADLEEVYFYQIRPESGFAIQRVYTGDDRLDETLVAHHNEAVLVPEGYHPVAAAPGYTCYYLNFLAGSAQSLANADDPAHAWVKDKWPAPDPRVPLVTPAMDTP